MNTPTAYPLQWPSTWPMTDPAKREKGKFSSTLAGALVALEDEVRRLGGTGLILSSNYTLGVNNPSNPGVVAYFTYDKVAVAIPCDRWLKIEHNVKAIALTIEAMRGMERWGAKHMIKAMFTGFKALPGPAGKKHWSEIIRLVPNASKESAHEIYRVLAKSAHPDAGGSDAAMSALNVAWSELKKEKGW